MADLIWFAAGWITAKHIDPLLDRAGRAIAAAYRRRHSDGSSAPSPGSQASQQNTEPSSRRAANASDAEAGLGSTGPGGDPSRQGRAGTPPATHIDGGGDA